MLAVSRIIKTDAEEELDWMENEFDKYHYVIHSIDEKGDNIFRINIVNNALDGNDERLIQKIITKDGTWRVDEVGDDEIDGEEVVYFNTTYMPFQLKSVNRDDMQHIIDAYGFVIHSGETLTLSDFADKIAEVYDLNASRNHWVFDILKNTTGRIGKDRTGQTWVKYQK